MQKLTDTEEEIMHHIWRLRKCTVSQILDQLGSNPPPHSTVSSVVRILEKKGFVGHKAYGRTYEYYPTVKKKEYSAKFLEKVVGDYFKGSPANLVSFLIKEKKIKKDELNQIIKELENPEK